MISRKSKRGKWAFKYCRGFGLEIGALHAPFDLKATVLYLDWKGKKGLEEFYAGDRRATRIKPVHLIASKPPYDFLDDGIFDFVLSSHVLEHMPNPGLALEEWFRLIAPGGLIYGIIPNKEECFDRTRKTTPLQVLLDAFDRRDPEAPLKQYRDYYLNKELPDGEARESEDEIHLHYDNQNSIHVYTYSPNSAKDFLEAMAKRLSATLEFYHVDGVDIHFLLRKPGPSSVPAVPIRKKLRGIYRRIRGLNAQH